MQRGGRGSDGRGSGISSLWLFLSPMRVVTIGRLLMKLEVMRGFGSN